MSRSSAHYLTGTKLGVTSLSGQMYFIMTTMVTYQVPITLRALQRKNNTSHMIIMQWGGKKWNPQWVNTQSGGLFVPGILLKANLFRDGERKNNQDSGDNDCEFAVSVPGGAGCTICFMNYSIYHWNSKHKWVSFVCFQTVTLILYLNPMQMLIFSIKSQGREEEDAIISFTRRLKVRLHFHKQKQHFCTVSVRQHGSAQWVTLAALFVIWKSWVLLSFVLFALISDGTDIFSSSLKVYCD